MNIDRNKLERVLLTLEAQQLFNYDWNSKLWSLNETSELFLIDCYADYIKFNLSPMFFEGCSAISESLKTNKIGAEIKFNSSFFDLLSSKPEYLRDFSNGLASHSQWISDELLPKIHLEESSIVLSIGGHTGSLLCELSKHHHHIQSVVFDAPLFIKSIESRIQEYYLAGRIKVQAGNYLDHIPQGFDTIICESIAK